MMSKGMQAGIRHFLPLCAAVSVLAAGVSTGQEKLSGKADSPIDEPHVVIQDSPHSVPVRAASIEITESTDPLVKLVYETREAQRRRGGGHVCGGGEAHARQDVFNGNVS